MEDFNVKKELLFQEQDFIGHSGDPLTWKIECDAGVDKLRHGIYADACGLPRKVARCDGFQRRVSCEDEFRRQMLELIN